MNNFKPSLGIEFDDKYIDAKNKLICFIAALNGLTEEQRLQLAREFLASYGVASSFEQFVKYMNDKGQF